MSAITIVKEYSPEKLVRTLWAKELTIWKPTMLRALEASTSASSRGRRPWQAIELFASELGRAASLPIKCIQQAEEASFVHGGVAVGPAHSRGVAGVMPGGTSRGSLEGAGSIAQRAALSVHRDG